MQIALTYRRSRVAAFVAAAAAILAAACTEQAVDGEPSLRRVEQAAAHPGPWEIPADVRAAGEAQYVAYDGAPAWTGGGNCAAGLRPGARDLGDYILEHFGGACQIQGYNCRPNSANPSRMSVHGTGRAIDIIVPTVGGSSACFDAGGSADNDLGDPIGNWLIENAEDIGVQYIIWDWWRWLGNASGRKDALYCGGDASRCHPHHNHLHVELTTAGANRETPWFIDNCAGGSCDDPGDPEDTCLPEPVEGAEDEVFQDMLPGDFGYEAAHILWRAGITNGCSSDPRMYCPSCSINRYAMVVFLLRAAEIELIDPPATPTFDDVSPDRWYYPYVETAAELGITTGCGGGSFCPTDPVTRGQAAAFITRTQGWPLLDPAEPSFDDVPTDYLFYRAIETIYDWCITNGCGSGNYCPEDSLTRAQAAIFVARAFDLEGINGCVEFCDDESCEAASYCEPWGDCAYADACDEQAEQQRDCHQFACQGTIKLQTCVETVVGEAESCLRDTEGVTLGPWSGWTTCAPGDDGGGEQSRSRPVCVGGSAGATSQTRDCEVGSEPDPEPDAGAGDDVGGGPSDAGAPDAGSGDVGGPGDVGSNDAGGGGDDVSVGGDGVVVESDSGNVAPDAAFPDVSAGDASDGGASGGTTTLEGGCGCAATGGSDGSWWVVAALGVVSWRRRRPAAASR